MDDIQYCSRDCNLYLFADDTNVFVSGKTVPDVTKKANNCMCHLIPGSRLRLSLNLDKINFSVFGAGKSHINFELIDAAVINQVNTCKYLGIMIDDKLSWQDHIDFVYNKVSSSKWGFKKVDDSGYNISIMTTPTLDASHVTHVSIYRSTRL